LFRTEVIEARKARLEGEVILAQPVRANVLTLIVLLIMALLGAWVVLGSYTRSEVARGILVTDAPSAKVIAIRPGQIAELPVRDGDKVAAGQKLATIRVEQADENGVSATAESLAALDAQRGLADHQALLAARRASAERARLAATLDGLRRQRADLSEQSDLQEQAAASARQLFEAISPVMERGFVSRVEYERRRQAMLAARQQLAQLRQQSSALAAEEGRALAELARIDADAGTEIASAQSSAQAIAQQRAQALASRAYVLASPIAGRVTALQASAGKTVDGSAPLMVVVPEGSALRADIYAPTRAIGFVKPGQEVRLLYDAFPYQRFGSFSGKVTRVSRTVLDPREIAAPLKIDEPVYRIEVALDRQQVEAFGQSLALQPGMTLSANLILDRRSFADWLLQPLNAVLRRSG
jgi:membrane fusion protein